MKRSLYQTTAENRQLKKENAELTRMVLEDPLEKIQEFRNSRIQEISNSAKKERDPEKGHSR